MYFAVNVSGDSPNGDEHDVQSHMFRPTITDMQEKYCANCYDVYPIQTQYTKVAALGRDHKRGMVCLNMCGWTSCSSPFGESSETFTTKYGETSHRRGHGAVIHRSALVTSRNNKNVR